MDVDIQFLDDMDVYGFFHRWGSPKMDGLQITRENPTKIDDKWGTHIFRKPPYLKLETMDTREYAVEWNRYNNGFFSTPSGPISFMERS